MEAIGGRKFVLAILAMIVGGAIEVFSPKGLSVQMTSLLVGIIGIFSGANTFLTKTTLKKDPEVEPDDSSEHEVKVEAPPAPAVAPAAIDHTEQLVRIETTVAQVAQGVVNTNQILMKAMGR